jgi:hypothetical protein
MLENVFQATLLVLLRLESAHEYAGSASVRLADSPATTVETLGKIDAFASKLEQNRFSGTMASHEARFLQAQIDDALQLPDTQMLAMKRLTSW